MNPRALTATVAVLVLALLGAGLVMVGQSRQLTAAAERLDQLEAATAASQVAQQKAQAAATATSESLAAAQAQIAGLSATLSGTQNRLTADEQQLKVTQQSLPPDVTALAEKVTPSVVLVSCGGDIGTGFSLALPGTSSSSSAVVTAAHVVTACTTAGGGAPITVTAAKRTVTATLRASDEDTDVAVLDVAAVIAPLEPAASNPRVGEFVMAVGNPLGVTDLANSVTQGNVSSVSADIVTHTAAISNGNSGGPLVDSTGGVVGIVVSAVTAGDNHPVVENLNLAVRLHGLCTAAVHGSVCSTLH